MVFTRRFFRAAAVCSFLSVGTTLLLIFLPRWIPSATDLAARMDAHGHPAYLVRSWVYFCHPFLVLVAALGVAVRAGVRSPGFAVFGFVCFMLWAFLEAAQQGLTLVAFDRLWRPAFLAADAAGREAIAARVAVYDALWDSLFFVLVIGIALGSLLYGWILVGTSGLGRVVGVLYLVIAAWSVYGMAVDWGAPPLPSVLDDWLYPVVQPVARALIGVWLWQSPPLMLNPVRAPG
ncbi:MAG TPA: hypothetical protein VHJ69_12725 [Gemmatimonadales bacterium]|jgi:hypothetical protein|nr:hypothetical protein [Gemmatimonadales bacterium]